MKVTREFSNFDVFAIVKELDTFLLNSSISNIYEVQDLLILKINTNDGKKNLIIKSDSRINLTDYEYPIPDYPNQYIRSIRKFLKNRQILSVSQFKFDRIIIIELTNYEGGSWKLVIELFNKGNFLLLDQNNTIIIAKKYRKLKNRTILAKREYNFPPSQGLDFFTIKNDDFKVLFKNSSNEIVRDLSRKLNLSGLYSEELCHRAKVDKKIHSNDLNDENFNSLYDSFRTLRNQLVFGTVNAHIVFDQQGNEVTVLPFGLEIFADYEKKFFPSFNIAVDEFYSKLDSKSILSSEDNEIEDKIRSQLKILKNQQNYLEELKIKKKKYYEIGDFLYANLNIFEKLLAVITNARKKGYYWDEINERLRKAKMENLEGTEFFEKIIPSANQVLVLINEYNVYIDINKSLGENANIIYSKGKKAESKIKGTLKAINDTKKKLEKLELKKESKEAEVDFLVKKPKKKWFEKFRWFTSSDGFLVIGGRDSNSNEIIFKKHLNANDLVFHTNFPGSPLVVIKNPNNKNIPEKTINETADFVASFSRAWRENWGVVDVFYVSTNQITKTPPSGEYIQKGSFVISGKKNFIKNAKTELAVGLRFIDLGISSNSSENIFYPTVISGPESAIKKQTANVVVIIPSKSDGFKKGKIAKDLKAYWIRNSQKKLRKWVEMLKIDEILLYLPSGYSKVKQ
ncbi:MAG: ribosome rescue protein RqcH [Candidatus Thorarchaeota archaeon]